MVQYKYTYFPLRGRGEFIRYIFAYAGVDYEDDRMPPSAEKPGVWKARKEELPFGHIPTLEVDGKLLADSTAIGRYLARQFGLAGNTQFERALVDQHVAQMVETQRIITPTAVSLFQPDRSLTVKEFDKARKELDHYLSLWEHSLRDNDKTHLVGSGTTWADIAVAELVERLRDFIEPKVTEKFPLVGALVDRITKHTNVAKHIAKRPKSTF